MPYPPCIEALRSPAPYPHPCGPIQVIETHISWVLLTGSYAYKIKKPVELGFLDYTSLERRRFYCQEELRLNRRLAPHIYLAVASITGRPEAPEVQGRGEAFEYAVKMHQFAQQDLLSERLSQGTLPRRLIDTLAERLSDFHLRIEAAPEASPFGSPQVVYSAMVHNFEALRAQLPPHQRPSALDGLERWTRTRYHELRPALARRKAGGFVRECHGDLHLGNIAQVQGEITIFDGIEFNPELRWIDVISELAFLVMDLDDRAARPLARRAVNRYLQATGDYAGLLLLRFYQVYRALVRAKVEAIRTSQEGLSEPERSHHVDVCQGYARLAQGYTRPVPRALLITHGLSGTGKSTLCQALVEQTEVIWLRSDVERKRLYGLAPTERVAGAVERGIYATQASERTYATLLDLAETILGAGFAVVVDATFLRSAQRGAFAALALRLGVPFRILRLQAPEALLRRRVVERARSGADPSDAGVAVLEHQLASLDPLSSRERDAAITVDTDRPFPVEGIAEAAGLAAHVRNRNH
jgi:aminoglycoside phosphotransferase family enzyme/predicted kinase